MRSQCESLARADKVAKLIIAGPIYEMFDSEVITVACKF